MTGRSLLSEVQRDLLDGKPLADLLRKCILLGSESGSADLRGWATKELRGYKDANELPSYRHVSAHIQVDAVTGNTWIRGQAIPASQLPEFARERITNVVPLFAGVGELESLYDTARTSGKSPQLSVPGWEYIARAIDSASGNPFQQIQAMYWTLSASAIAGVLDDVRTALTELLAELGVVMPAEQDTPTAEQATNALHVAISGGSSQVNITAPNNSIHSSGNSQVDNMSGPAAAAGDSVVQHVAFDSTHTDAVSTWLEEYRSVLPAFSDELRPVVETQLEQLSSEIAKPEPQEVVITTLMGSLRTFAQNAIASAGAGAGTIGLTELLAHWPF